MPIDISGLSYFMPIFGFLFVFVIIFALLIKTKILGDNKFINILISFIVAIVFSVVSPARTYVENVTPWFAVLIVALFFILIIIGLSQQKIDAIMKPGVVWVFIIILILIFVISAISVFSSTFEVLWLEVRDYISLEDRIFGGVLLFVIALIVAFIITKK